MKIQVNARNRAYHFSANQGQRILYAGLADGINLPYECGSGTCGTCKARVTAGDVEDKWPEAPGRKVLKQPGEILMCQCVARGDISIEVANFVYNMDPGACLPSAGKGIVRNPRMLTHDVIAFSIETEQPTDFDAGQFMLVEVPGVTGFRGYSMVNFEHGTRRLDFVVKKKSDGGASRWLFGNRVEGQEVSLFGPLGTATFFPALAKNLLLIAGGSGIAGMMAILSRACQEHYFDQFKGHVYFGVRTLKDAFFLEELAAFRRTFPANLEITIVLSDEAVPDKAVHPDLAFDQGMVHQAAGRGMKGRYQNMRAYLAGPPPAVDASIRLLLLEARLTADNIRYDKFS